MILLKEVTIKNFAILKDVSVSFSPGLNVITGETGSGKSLLLSAVSAAVGGRMRKEDVGSEGTEIETLFEIKENTEIKNFLKEHDIESDDEIVIRRVVQPSGRGKITINGRLVPLSILSPLGNMLLDMSGQHEQQVLLRESSHISFLDRALGLEAILKDYKEAYHKLLSLRSELEGEKNRARRLAEQKDFLKFQLKEINSLDPRPGEEMELEEERDKLRSAERILSTAAEIESIISESEEPLIALIKRLSNAIDMLLRYDLSLKDESEKVREFIFCLEDVLYKVRPLKDSLEGADKRLEEVEERLSAIKSLSRKYGSLEAALEERDKIASELDSMSFSDEKIVDLEKRVKELEKEVFRLGEKLSTLRIKGKGKLEKKVISALEDLSMKGVSFVVEIAPFDETDVSDGVILRGRVHKARGRDSVRFLLSANPGEPPMRLSKVASGGELSRILLALKEVLGGGGMVSVFDEIDTGIGGAVAEEVGRKLRALAASSQVIAVTHLPQIASLADNHIRALKSVGKNGVSVKFDMLGSEDRKREIARMLAGRRIGKEAVAQADALLKNRKEP